MRKHTYVSSEEKVAPRALFAFFPLKGLGCPRRLGVFAREGWPTRTSPCDETARASAEVPPKATSQAASAHCCIERAGQEEGEGGGAEKDTLGGLMLCCRSRASEIISYAEFVINVFPGHPFVLFSSLRVSHR